MHRNGFALFELVVVIAVISTITAMLWSSYNAIVEKYGNDTTQLEQLEEQYNFTYYNNLTTPDIVDYRAILESYGIDCSNLTDDEIREMVERLYGDE